MCFPVTIDESSSNQKGPNGFPDRKSRQRSIYFFTGETDLQFQGTKHFPAFHGGRKNLCTQIGKGSPLEPGSDRAGIPDGRDHRPGKNIRRFKTLPVHLNQNPKPKTISLYLPPHYGKKKF